jgi:hypothetical protein
MPSYDLLSELPLKHKSHNYSSSLPKLLLIITLTNISNITRIRQTKHIKDKAKAIIVTKVFKKISEAIVTLEAVTVFKKVKTIVNIIY